MEYVIISEKNVYCSFDLKIASYFVSFYSHSFFPLILRGWTGSRKPQVGAVRDPFPWVCIICIILFPTRTPTQSRLLTAVITNTTLANWSKLSHLRNSIQSQGSIRDVLECVWEQNIASVPLREDILWKDTVERIQTHTYTRILKRNIYIHTHINFFCCLDSLIDLVKRFL